MEEKIIRKLSGLNEETRSLVVELIELFLALDSSIERPKNG